MAGDVAKQAEEQCGRRVRDSKGGGVNLRLLARSSRGSGPRS